MTRGEHDYTQRVLATIRPSGIVGGRLLFEEDFEYLTLHDVADTTTHPTITSTAGEVYAGHSAGKYTTDAGDSKSAEYRYPTPLRGFIGGEFVFRALDENILSTTMRMHFMYDEILHLSGARVTYTGGKLTLQIYDSTGAWKTLKEISVYAISPFWHVLHLKVNLATGYYVGMQYDSHYMSVTTERMPIASATSSDEANLWLDFQAKTGLATTVVFDNVIITFEEI